MNYYQWRVFARDDLRRDLRRGSMAMGLGEHRLRTWRCDCEKVKAGDFMPSELARLWLSEQWSALPGSPDMAMWARRGQRQMIATRAR